MSSLFGFLDFTKPGHFVDDSHYPPFIRFWKRYARHFVKLLSVNLFFAILTLPIYTWLMSLINVAFTQAGFGMISLLGPVLIYFSMKIPGPILAVLLIGSVLLLGPASAALSYATLTLAWDKPGLFWDEFRLAWKTNWKQALPIGFLDMLICFGTVYYLTDAIAVYQKFGVVLIVLWVLLLLVYGMIRVYLYPMMVTVDLPLGALIKNALILSLLQPWRPLLVLLISLVFCLLCVFADLLIVPCFLFSFVAYTAAFVSQPMLDKYLIHPTQNTNT